MFCSSYFIMNIIQAEEICSRERSSDGTNLFIGDITVHVTY